jgi:hypothetical protein
MKTKNVYITVITLIFMALPITGHAQFFKKLKKILSGEKEVTQQDFSTKGEMTFGGWSYGDASIVMVSPRGGRQVVGGISADGSFNYFLPFEAETKITVEDLTDCDNEADSEVTKENVPASFGLLFVLKGNEYIGSLVPASSMEKALTFFDRTGKSSQVGDFHFLWIYAEEDVSLSSVCVKNLELPNGDSLLVENTYDYELLAGWNVVKASITENTEIESETYYTKRHFEVVEDIPDTIEWHFLFTRKK